MSTHSLPLAVRQWIHYSPTNIHMSEDETIAVPEETPVVETPEVAAEAPIVEAPVEETPAQ